MSHPILKTEASADTAEWYKMEQELGAMVRKLTCISDNWKVKVEWPQKTGQWAKKDFIITNRPERGYHVEDKTSIYTRI